MMRACCLGLEKQRQAVRQCSWIEKWCGVCQQVTVTSTTTPTSSNNLRHFAFFHQLLHKRFGVQCTHHSLQAPELEVLHVRGNRA